MKQEQIELRMLHEQHIKNMINLERQRQMLDKQNPLKYAMTGTIERDKQTQHIDRSKIPALKPDRIIQRLLYYPPSFAQAEVADRTSKAILTHWDGQTQYIPQDVQMQFMLKYGKKDNISLQLTPSGHQHVDQLIDYAKKYRELAPSMSLRQKYSQHYVPRTEPRAESKQKS